MKHSRVFIDQSGLYRAFKDGIISAEKRENCIRNGLGLVFTKIGDRKELFSFDNKMKLRDLVDIIEEKEKVIMQIGAYKNDI